MTTKSKKTPHSTGSKAAGHKAKPQAPASKAAAKPAAKMKAKAASASVKPSKTAKPAAKSSASKAKAAPAAKAKAAAKAAPAKPAAKKPAAALKGDTKHVEPKSTGIHPKPKSEAPAARPQAKIEAKAEVKAEPHKEEAKKPTPAKAIFKAKEFVVYPAHGVGQILDIEEQEVAGYKLELFVINFDKEKMTLRVPTHKAQAVGMRKLSDANVVGNAIETLRGRARIKRTMWSRRAQEYEAKINSGDLISIAEVVRDLYRSERQPEQSYSERQLYEAALDRMAREVAVVERIGEDAAILRVEAALQGGSGRGEKASDKEAPEAA